MSYFHKGNRRNSDTPSKKLGCFDGVSLPPDRTQRRIYDLFFVRAFAICTTVTEKNQS